jgi:hypothetical protein
VIRSRNGIVIRPQKKRHGFHGLAGGHNQIWSAAACCRLRAQRKIRLFRIIGFKGARKLACAQACALQRTPRNNLAEKARNGMFVSRISWIFAALKLMELVAFKDQVYPTTDPMSWNGDGLCF